MSTSSTSIHPAIKEILDGLNKVVYGKSSQTKLALACLFAQGHLLIEDYPGMGKSTLVKALSKILGLETKRVQFTNDLLPADIIGSSLFYQEKGTFAFHKGPLFTQLFFADELNRATPKTQSACLQAMEEYEISIDGETYELPKPFFVIATQNPSDNVGTFPLPESQLDRFLMKIQLGYPDRQAEKSLLLDQKSQQNLLDLKTILAPHELLEIQLSANKVHVSENIVNYIQDIVEETRTFQGRGVSPRGALSLIRAAKAWAFIEGRSFIVPEDIKRLAPSVLGHRIGHEVFSNEFDNNIEFVNSILDRVPIKE